MTKTKSHENRSLILNLSRLKRFSTSIKAWEFTPLCLLIIMLLILHFSTIMQPATYAFDEHYYVPAAKSILSGNGLGRIEHPPLGQAIIASGIGLFGDNPLGWRFFSVIFGVISLFLFYLICRQLKLSKYTSTLATFLLAIDNLTFIQSGVGMLDIYLLTFMLLSFWLFLKNRYSLTGIAIGLASMCKLTGVLAILGIFLYWLVTDRKNIKRIIIPVGISGISFVILLPLIDFAILHKFLNPIEQINTMIMNTLSLTFTDYNNNPVLGMVPSRPWEWLYHLGGTRIY